MPWPPVSPYRAGIPHRPSQRAAIDGHVRLLLRPELCLAINRDRRSATRLLFAICARPRQPDGGASFARWTRSWTSPARAAACRACPSRSRCRRGGRFSMGKKARFLETAVAAVVPRGRGPGMCALTIHRGRGGPCRGPRPRPIAGAWPRPPARAVAPLPDLVELAVPLLVPAGPSSPGSVAHLRGARRGPAGASTRSAAGLRLAASAPSSCGWPAMCLSRDRRRPGAAAYPRGTPPRGHGDVGRSRGGRLRDGHGGIRGPVGHPQHAARRGPRRHRHGRRAVWHLGDVVGHARSPTRWSSRLLGLLASAATTRRGGGRESRPSTGGAGGDGAMDGGGGSAPATRALALPRSPSGWSFDEASLVHGSLRDPTWEYVTTLHDSPAWRRST